MRRRTAVAALALTFTAAFTTATATAAPATTAPAKAAPGGHSKATLLDKVPRRGVLRVCTTGDYRPFTYKDPKTGAYTGIDIDMAKHLAASLGVKADFVATTWTKLMDDFTAGKCDIGMGGISVTLARAQKAYFSEPYLVDGKAPIARCADKDKYDSLAKIDQAGVRVIVNPGGTNEKFAKANIRNATIITHPDNNTIFDEIVAGRADVMMTDGSETKYQAKLHPELCAINPDKPFTFAEKAYLLPRGDEEFQEYTDQWVHLTTRDGTYKGFAEPWQS
ncbi:transporter substrate-binding domain-containing protein [Actinomadura rudentiformis]|uniref:Transporter substrate-binding domain-containing protein n=1 Tax=Actinomadura rudentiformis TaxID=359158 RepID=A0A6H9Y8I1_9ACTN|nr:transporter substrate-binding domain-containing protein [Actinomadura rudentiformis]KAB2340408.1 transporter substrate-binding domain-containing protein [Actinomadura rudentiformis]